MDTKTSKKPLPLWKVLHSLRGIAILGVLLSHAASVVKFAGEHYIPTNFSVSLLWIILIQIPGYCVPLFLFLSGHFLATTSHTWKAIFNRLKKLFIPFLFWSLFAWFWNVRAFFFTFEFPEWGWTPKEFFIRLITGNTHLGYFFFVLIFQWYLLARWIVPWTKKSPAKALTIALLVQVCCSLFNYYSVFNFAGSGKEPILILRYLFILYPFYIILGIVVGLYPKSFSEFFSRIKTIIPILSIIIFFLVLIESEVFYNILKSSLKVKPKYAYHFSMAEWKFSYELWGLAGIFFFILLFRYKIPNSKLYKSINSEAYPLFLLNGPTIILLNYSIQKLDINPPKGLLFFIVLGVEIFFPLLVVNIIRKRFKILKWMIGE